MGSILVVDDERSIRITVKAFLEDDGHSVETAEDAQSAMVILEGRPTDVVLTDIVLPRMSGIDLLKRVREASPDVLVIMMTGEPTLETAAESLRCGAMDYLQKPIAKNDLLKVIRNALHIKSLDDEKKRLEEQNHRHMYHLEQLVAERTRALTESESSLRRRADELAVLNHLARELGATMTVDATLQSGLREIARAACSDFVLVFLRKEERLIQRGLFAEGGERAWQPASVHRMGECLCGLAARENRPVYSLDIHADFRCTMDECKKAGFSSFAALPLKSGTEVLGTLGLASIGSRDFGSQGSFLEALASELSIGLKKSLLYEQLQEDALELQAGIEQLKAAEAERLNLLTQLQQAQKMEAIGVLAGGIAHDFNNILAAIIGFAELGLCGAEKDVTLHRYFEQVLGAGLRARDLVQQILTFSRQCEKAVSPISVKPIAREALKLLRASLPTTIEFRQDIRSDMMVMADPTNIHQLLMNLCANAAHAMRKKGGILDVSLTDVYLDSAFAANHPGSSPGPHVKLAVSDTGQGMSKSIQERIFDPFFTTKKRGEGTGLGLSVVHGIIRSLNGSIMVSSKPGRGTSFEIFLPAIDTDGSEKPSKVESTPTGNEHILLVDDERALVDVNTHILMSLGYKVTGTTGALEALDIFRSRPWRFDMVITDLTMPQMKGDMLAKALLEIRPDLPVILCSGFSASIDAKRMEELGIRALLHKPILRREIAEAIRQAFDAGKNGLGE